MGNAGAKQMGNAGAKSASEEGGNLGEVVIKNSTKEEVVIREKHRAMPGPIRYKIPAEKEIKLPCLRPGGTYFRYAVLVGTDEIGTIPSEDLEKRKLFTIRGESGNCEITIEDN